MPTQKIDPKVIFASDAPTIDKPPVFSDKTKGWDVARANDGRPTIKEMNKVQQDTDLKILWLNENSVTPYDASIDYPEGAVTLKDGSFKQLVSGAWVEFLDDFADKAEVNAALSAKADKTYVDGQLALKADESEVDKFYPTLAQANADIANIAVNQPVNISESQNFGLWYKATAGATSLTKSPYDPLTQAKKFVGNTGFASIAGAQQSNINYVTATRSLEFKNTLWVTTETDTIQLTTPKIVSLPVDTVYRIEYNTASGVIDAVAYNAPRNIESVVVGTVYATADTLKTVDFSFTVDGVVQNPPHTGELITDDASRINFDNLAKALILNASVRVKTQYTTTDLSALTLEQRTIPYPATVGFYTLQYNLTTKLFSFRLNSVLQPLNTADIAQVKFTAGNATNIFGVDIYAVDGKVVATFSEGVNVGYLLPVSKTDINFDFVNKRLIVVADRVRIVSSVKLPSISTAVNLDISGEDSFLKRLLFNTATNTFRAIRANAATLDTEVQVAIFCVRDGFVDGVQYYSINGKPVGGLSENITSVRFKVPYGVLEANYNQPTLDEYATLRTTNLGDYNKVYALYDALVAAHPDYITKTVLGVDGLGNPINQYQFTTPEVENLNFGGVTYERKPKVLLISGVHGAEQAGIYNLYFSMKEIVERWRDDERLEALYWGVNFLVVPIAVPTGFNATSRYNHNNVDIARNFTADWSAAQPNSGGTPLSQAESTVLDSFMSNNKDAIYFGSHHNFGASTATTGGFPAFIWNASGTQFGTSLAKSLAVGETIRSKKHYPSMPQANDYYIGYSNMDAPPGSEGLHATKTHGVQGGTFEICSYFHWELGQTPFSSMTATIGVETFINWLLLNVKHGCELYNSKVNL